MSGSLFLPSVLNPFIFPPFYFWTFPVSFHPNNLCPNSWSQPLLPLPNCFIEDPLGVSLASLTPSCPPANMLSSLSSSRPPAFPLFSLPSSLFNLSSPNMSKAFKRIDPTASALSFPIYEWPLNAKSWGFFFSLPPGSWHYSVLLTPSLNCSSLVSSPCPSPFILFLSLSCSLLLKQLVQILVELKLPGESWTHLQKQWFRLGMGPGNRFGLIRFCFLYFFYCGKMYMT